MFFSSRSLRLVLLHLLLTFSLILTLLPATTVEGAISTRQKEVSSLRNPSDTERQPEASDHQEIVESALGASNEVSILTSGFSPSILEVPVATQVTWINNDSVEHHLRSGTPPALDGFAIYMPRIGTTVGAPSVRGEAADWESGVLAPGERFSFTFDEVGTFAYYDPSNPLLVGQILVTTPSRPNSPPTVEIAQPPQGAVTGSTLQVSGTVNDDVGVTSVSVNGTAATLNGNQFEATVNLPGGGNHLITVAATDGDGAVSSATRVVSVDGEGPNITVLRPRDRQSVYNRQPNIEIQFADSLSSIDGASFSAVVSSSGGSTDVTSELTVSADGASGTLSTLLSAGASHELIVSIADNRGNRSEVRSTFYIPANVETITPPALPSDAGWVSGQVFDSATCDVHLTQCSGLPGASVTLVEVNPSAVARVRNSRKEAIHNLWMRNRSDFAPLSPGQIALTDAVSGTVISGPDGFFAFPVSESGTYWLRVERDGYTYGQREVELVANHHTATEAIYLTPLDGAVTTCDETGCSHTNSDGSMQVIIPAGAIAPGESLDVTATPFDQVEFLPSGGLPEGTWETYAFNLGGDSDYSFQPGKMVTVRIANSRGFAPGTPIPLGFWNDKTLAWEHAGTGTVDASGQWVEMEVSHFSNYDCNDPIVEPDFETEVEDQTDDDDIQQCPDGELGCFIPVQSGTLGEEIRLPSVTVLDEEVAPTFLYNSKRAVPSEVIDFRFLLDFQQNTTLGETIGFELFIEGERTEDFTFDATLNPGEVGRFRYYWDGHNAQGELLPAGLYPYSARFRVPYQSQYCYALNGIFGNPPDCENGATGVFVEGEKFVSIEGTVDLNTQVESTYGAGWVLGDLQRLYEDDFGRILITDGDRSVEFYAPAQDIFSTTAGSALPTGIHLPVLTPPTPADGRISTSDQPPYRVVRSVDSTVVQGVINSNTVWDLAGSPYVVTGTVTVLDGVSLTIEAGVQVQFNTNQGLFVLGALQAVGSAANPINFGPLPPNPAGSWLGITLGGGAVGDSDASQLQHLVISGGAQANLSILDSYPMLSDFTVRQAAKGTGLNVVQFQTNGTVTLDSITAENNGLGGLSLTGGDYILNNLTVRNNNGTGISVNNGTSQATLSNSRVNGNVSVAQIPAQTVLTNNDLTGNISNIIAWTGGQIAGNVTWDIPGIEGYQIVGVVTVQNGASLTIPGGTPIDFAGQDTLLDVHGALQAIGSPTAPIRFGSLAAQGAQNSGQIDLRGPGSSLSNVLISDLDGQPGALNIYANTPTLDRLTVEENGNDGIYVENGGALTVQQSIIRNNGGNGITNATPGQPVDARNNFWGAISGPFHPTLNPAGVGDEVSDGVLFDPWLTAPPGASSEILNQTADDFSELTYDADNQRYVRRYRDGTTIYFDSQGRHEKSVSRVGTTIAYSYNGDGAVTSLAITPASEAAPRWSWTFAYANGRLTEIGDPAGRTTTFSIDDGNALSSVLFPDGTERRFFYDSDGLMTQQVDQAGDTTSYSYDQYGRVRTVTEPPRPIFDPDTGQVAIISELITFTPSETGYELLNESATGTPDNPAASVPGSTELVDRVAYGRGVRSGHTNRWGLWSDVTDGVGRTTRFTRDEENNLTEEHLPGGDCVTYTYDENGNRLSRNELPASECGKAAHLRALDQGLSWTFTYEPRFDRIKSETDPRGNTTTYVYDYEENAGDVGNLIRIELPQVNDENGQPAVPTIRFTYDANGQLLTETDPRGIVTRYIYTQGTADEADGGANARFLPGVAPVPGLLTQVIEDAGGAGDLNVTTISRGFDGAGNPTVVVEPHGAVYTYQYDAMNRIVSETDPLGVVTLTEYDPRGNPARLVDDFTPAAGGLNVVTTFEYNLYQQLIRQQTVGVDGLIRGVTNHYDINRNLAQTIDAMGNGTSYFYDDADQLVRTVDALGNTTTYEYDQRGFRTRIVHPDGTQDRSAYDAFGRLVEQIEDDGGLNLSTTYTYDGSGNVIRTSDPTGMVTCFTYDALNRQTGRTLDCEGLKLVDTFTFDLANRLVRRTDARGVVQTTTYDDLDRPLGNTADATGLQIQTLYTYDANGDLLSIVDGRGNRTAFTYDPLSRMLTETTDPGGLNLLTAHSYDALGRRISTTDPVGDVTTFAVNEVGETVLQRDPLGNTTTFTYDNAGNLLSTTDPTGVTLRHGYDDLYRLVTVTNPLGDSLRYEYDSRSNRVGEIDPNGNRTVYTYDGAQRQISMTDAQGNVTRFTYDGMDRMLTQSEPLGFVSTYSYDALGRLNSETNPLGERTTFAYDGVGNLLTEVGAIPPGGNEANGQRTTWQYDGLSRPTQESDPLNRTTAYEYDPVGNRSAIVDPRGNRTTLTYDAANRLSSLTDPLNQTTTYQYNGRGQIVRITYANGDLVTSTYDAAGREIRVDYSDGLVINRTFDGAGRMTRVVDAGTDIDLRYDAVGRVQTIGDGRLGKNVSYSYDANGNRIRLSAPDGLTSLYTYDSLNRLTAVVQANQQVRFAYDVNSRMTEQIMGDAARMQMGYDDAGRVTELIYRDGNAGQIDRIAYRYDAAGNRVETSLGNGDTITFGYDGANQLTGEQRNGSLSYAQSFTYDAAGNRTNWTLDGNVTNYAHNAANQLTQENLNGTITTYTYDSRNRLTATTGATNQAYGYSVRGEMTSVTSTDGTATYVYDAFRRRTGATVGGETVNYLHDDIGIGTTILAEYGGNGALLAGYMLAPNTDARLARSVSGSSSYYLPDGLGSTRHLIDDGGVTGSYEYDAYGRILEQSGGSGNPYLFAARRWDDAIGLYDNRARRYDPRLGRFLQADPLGFVESSNLYQYALNNPVTRIDPLGWSSTDCVAVSKKSKDLLGLKKYSERVSSLLKKLPNAPTFKASGTIAVKGKLCQKCCKQVEAAGECPAGCTKRDKVGTISVSATAKAGITWPLAAIGWEIRGYGFKFGVEAFGALAVDITGAGEINLCKNQASFKLCGSGSVTGGIKAGLLKWPFEAVKVEAFVYGSITGSCRACINYSIFRGTTLLEAKCNACAEAGYEVTIKFLYDWVSVSRKDIFAKGCIY